MAAMAFWYVQLKSKNDKLYITLVNPTLTLGLPPSVKGKSNMTLDFSPKYVIKKKPGIKDWAVKLKIMW